MVTGSAVVALLLGGCLFSKVGYNSAETLVRWGVGDYLELDPEQRIQLAQILQQAHDWHRRDELPIYAAIALDAARRIERGLAPADLDWAEQTFRVRYDVLMAHGAAALAGLAATVRPDQVAKMPKRFARGNERFLAEYVKLSKEERARKRVALAIETAEDWVGALSASQKRMLTMKVAALPETAEHRYAQRLARQRAIRDLFEVPTTREKMVAGLRMWLVGWDVGRTAEHERVYAEWFRQSRQIVLDLESTLTRRQRAEAVERLRIRAANFTAWSKKVP